MPLRLRPLGKTGLLVSPVALGAGPVSGLMTGTDESAQFAVVSRAFQAGINWVDTAAGYGSGQSELSLGRCLARLEPAQPLHVATKVRVVVAPDDQRPHDWRPAVRASVQESLSRLGLAKVTLLQIHNAITARRHEEPAGITPEDVLGPRGVLAALQELREEDVVDFIGLTGTGHPPSLASVIKSAEFDTIQIPFHFLNPSALDPIPATLPDVDYGQTARLAASQGMGVFAIRVFAAGALLDASPSAHTLKTPYFPLALYERDRARAARWRQEHPAAPSSQELALRYVLSRAEISAAIVGLASPAEVDTAVRAATAGPLPPELLAQLHRVLEEPA